MDSKNYREILNTAYNEQKLSQQDFDNTLMHFADLYYQDRLANEKECLEEAIKLAKKSSENRTEYSLILYSFMECYLFMQNKTINK